MKDVHSSSAIHEFAAPTISSDPCHSHLVQAKFGNPHSDLTDNLMVVCEGGIGGTSDTSCVIDGRGHDHADGSFGSGGCESADIGLGRNGDELHGGMDSSVASDRVAIDNCLESSSSGDDQLLRRKANVEQPKVVSDCDESYGKWDRIIRDSVETTASTSDNAAERFVCPVAGCGRSYSRRQGLKRHTNAAHSDKNSSRSDSFSSNSGQDCCKDVKPLKDGSTTDQLSPVSESKFNKLDLPRDNSPKENPTTTNACWKCTKVECGRVFTNRQNLKRHLRGHQRYQYKCSQCPMEFIKHRQLKIHEFSHTKTYPFSCSVCEKKFVLPSRLRAHEKMHQGYRCQIDGCTREPFNKWSEMRKHVATAHPKIHHCDECSRAFATIPAMKRHFAKCHLSATSKLCRHPGCEVKLKPGMEKLHLRNHHGENSVPKSAVEANLKSEISFSEQPADMSGCGTLGAHSNSSSVDVEEKHKFGEISADIVGVKSPPVTSSDDSLKLFYCDKCSKCFAKERYLRWHIRRIHERCERSNPDGSVAKPYVCDHEGCGKSFARPYQLSQHRNAHLNLKPYGCEEPGCSRSYSGRQSLKKHLLEVHGVRLEAREALEDALGSLGSVEGGNTVTS